MSGPATVPGTPAPPPGTASRAQAAVEAAGLVLFPALFYWFWELYPADRRHRAYRWVLREDGPVEWGTVAALAAAGLLALLAFRSARGDGRLRRAFLLLFAAGCLVFALEEMSWGQRVLGVESPAFFEEHSDQREINAHNVLQKWLDVKTKHVAAWALGLYGGLLPLLAQAAPVRRLADRFGILVPPAAFVPGFLLGALLMRDVPTGQEEELGELFLALGLLLVALHAALARPRRG